MIDTDNVMNPQHFGSDPPDIQTRIRINPEIRIRTPDHFWLTFWPWRRFALSKHNLVPSVAIYLYVMAVFNSYTIITII